MGCSSHQPMGYVDNHPSAFLLSLLPLGGSWTGLGPCCLDEADASAGSPGVPTRSGELTLHNTSGSRGCWGDEIWTLRLGSTDGVP